MKSYNYPRDKIHFVFFLKSTKYRITLYCQEVQNTNTFYLYVFF